MNLTANDQPVKEQDEGENVWMAILDESEAREKHRLSDTKKVIILGDSKCGKSSLLSRLKKGDEHIGSGLEFHFMEVRDEYSDDHTQLSFYSLDGDPWHKNMLKFVLNANTFADCTIILMASMEDPCSIMESLKSWVEVLEEHISRLRLPSDVWEGAKERLLKHLQSYVEPGNDFETAIVSGENSVPLSNAEVATNLGLNIVVVINKTDVMESLLREHDYKDETVDFMQVCVRSFCAQYGASLCYTSTRYEKNLEILQKYLLHLIYGFKFETPALVIEKDAVFIPAGWDSASKRQILVDGLTTLDPDTPYEDVVLKPNTHKGLHKDMEIVAEDDDIFVTRLQGLMSQQLPANAAGRPQDAPIRPTPTSVQKTGDRRPSGSPGVAGSPKKLDGKMTATAGEGVLQNFFNSLLNRKTGPNTGSPMSSMRTPGDKSSVRHEAVAELDRMSGGRLKKPMSFSQGADSQCEAELEEEPPSSMPPSSS